MPSVNTLVTRARRVIDTSLLSATARSVRREHLTYLSPRKLRRLETVLQEILRLDVPGDVAEFGMALGGSAIVLATHARRRGRGFHGFDVFGMIPPPTSEKDDDKSRDRYRKIATGESKGLGGDLYYGYRDDLYADVCRSFTRFGLEIDNHGQPAQGPVRGDVAERRHRADRLRPYRLRLVRSGRLLSPGRGRPGQPAWRDPARRLSRLWRMPDRDRRIPAATAGFQLRRRRKRRPAPQGSRCLNGAVPAERGVGGATPAFTLQQRYDPCPGSEFQARSDPSAQDVAAALNFAPDRGGRAAAARLRTGKLRPPVQIAEVRASLCRRSRFPPANGDPHAIHADGLCERGRLAELTQGEQEKWLGAYRAYIEAMAKAGVLRESNRLQPTASGNDRARCRRQAAGAGWPLCRLQGAARRLPHHRRGRSRRRDRLGGPLADRAARRRRGAPDQGMARCSPITSADFIDPA